MANSVLRGLIWLTDPGRVMYTFLVEGWVLGLVMGLAFRGLTKGRSNG